MRIWVARPEPQATRTGMRLRALGHDPVVAPVLAVIPALVGPQPGSFDGFLLTSAQAIPALAGAVPAASRAAAAVFAVGERTAALVREAGFGSVAAADGDAAALAGLVRLRLAPGARLLHLAGAARKPEPAATLQAAGYAVGTVVAYAACAVPVLPEAVAAALGGAAPLAAALHYSRRSARIARDLAETAGRGGAFRSLKHYCLSADVAVPLVEAGIAAHVVAARPTEDALLASLDDAR